MKANELQIGDILNLSEVSGEIIPCKVEELHTDEFFMIRPNDKACDILGYNMVFPIELTPEILEKNGFEFVSDSTIAISSTKLLDIHTSIHFQFVNGQNCYVRLNHCGAGSYEFSKHIKSVHELQHALRLCGLDELANNFKI